MTADESRLRAARELGDHLTQAKLRLVLAESCTAGNVSAALAIIPGISAWLCGSFVIYRNESKAEWLHIPRHLLDDPAIGPVGPQVTELLARHALLATPEADISAAVTGHVGPGSPAGLDARVFLALVHRGHSKVDSRSCRLTSPAPRDAQDYLARETRLRECTLWVLTETRQALVAER